MTIIEGRIEFDALEAKHRGVHIARILVFAVVDEHALYEFEVRVFSEKPHLDTVDIEGADHFLYAPVFLIYQVIDVRSRASNPPAAVRLRAANLSRSARGE